MHCIISYCVISSVSENSGSEEDDDIIGPSLPFNIVSSRLILRNLYIVSLTIWQCYHSF